MPFCKDCVHNKGQNLHNCFHPKRMRVDKMLGTIKPAMCRDYNNDGQCQEYQKKTWWQQIRPRVAEMATS